MRIIMNMDVPYDNWKPNYEHMPCLLKCKILYAQIYIKNLSLTIPKIR